MAKNDDSLTFRFADGTVRELCGYKYAAPASGVKNFKSRYKSKQLPKKVDMRPNMTKVEDQMSVSSCTANAAAGAYEYLVKKNQGINYDVSRLFIYYNGRKADLEKGERMSDSGAFIQSVVEQMMEKGCCSESTWPYDYRKSVVNKKPDEEAYREAEKFKVKSIEHVDKTLDAWRSALAEGYPVIFGATLFDSFEDQRHGRIPEPSEKEKKLEKHGGHAMLCVGYSDPDKVFIVRNSWGRDWGDHGYCYMSYDYIMTYTDDDTWIIKDADKVEDNEDDWSDEKESLFADFNDELSKMSDEDWKDFNEEMGDYGFEYRIGVLFLAAACADGKLSDAELDEAELRLKNVLKIFGIKMKPRKILRNCMALAIGNHEFIQETIEIFNDYLSIEALANIYIQLMKVAKADKLSDDEEMWITDIADIWFEDEENYLDLAYPDAVYEDSDADDDNYFDYDYEEDEGDFFFGSIDIDNLEIDSDFKAAKKLKEKYDGLSYKDYKELMNQFGKYNMERRIGALLVAAASADGELTGKELRKAAVHLKKIMKVFGSVYPLKSVLLDSMTLSVGIEDFLDDTISTFGTYFPVEACDVLYKMMLEVASADADLNYEEKKFIAGIGKEWFDGWVDDDEDWLDYAFPDEYFDEDDRDEFSDDDSGE